MELSSGGSAGLAVLLIISGPDALDVNGQLASKGWRVLAAYHVPGEAPRDVATWVRT